MKLTINIEKKYAYIIMSLILISIGMLAVNAYVSDGSGNPIIMGHSTDEIDFNGSFIVNGNFISNKGIVGNGLVICEGGIEIGKNSGRDWVRCNSPRVNNGWGNKSTRMKILVDLVSINGFGEIPICMAIAKNDEVYDYNRIILPDENEFVVSWERLDWLYQKLHINDLVTGWFEAALSDQRVTGFTGEYSDWVRCYIN